MVEQLADEADRIDLVVVLGGGKGRPRTRGRADEAAAVVFLASGPQFVGGERYFQIVPSRGS
jgi:hypothetical protein